MASITALRTVERPTADRARRLRRPAPEIRRMNSVPEARLSPGSSGGGGGGGDSGGGHAGSSAKRRCAAIRSSPDCTSSEVARATIRAAFASWRRYSFRTSVPCWMTPNAMRFRSRSAETAATSTISWASLASQVAIAASAVPDPPASAPPNREKAPSVSKGEGNSYISPVCPRWRPQPVQTS